MAMQTNKKTCSLERIRMVLVCSFVDSFKLYISNKVARASRTLTRTMATRKLANSCNSGFTFGIFRPTP